MKGRHALEYKGLHLAVCKKNNCTLHVDIGPECSRLHRARAHRMGPAATLHSFTQYTYPTNTNL